MALQGVCDCFNQAPRTIAWVWGARARAISAFASIEQYCPAICRHMA